MTNNIVAFGSHFAAYGCTLQYNSEDASLIIVDSPKKSKDTIVGDAAKDIAKFEDTANYTDGAAAIALADFIDDQKNPLSLKIRENILVALGIKENNKYIRQVLSLSKSNRSWHISEVANDCSYFLSICTGRGTISANTSGRRSTRAPQDYHTLDSHGKVKREQLVTPAVENLWSAIPEDNFVSGERFSFHNNIIKKLKTMTIEDRIKVLTELGLEIANV